MPNEVLITQRVENLSRVNADMRIALALELRVVADTDVEALLPELEAAAREVPRVLPDPVPSAGLAGLAPDGLLLSITFWIDDPSRGQDKVRSGSAPRGASRSARGHRQEPAPGTGSVRRFHSRHPRKPTSAVLQTTTKALCQVGSCQKCRSSNGT